MAGLLGGGGWGAGQWDQLGLLGAALSGAGAGYNSRRRPVVSLNPAEVDPGSSGFAEMGLGAQQGYRQAQGDLQRRALLQTQMQAAQTAEEERKARLAEAERQRQMQAAYQAAIASGDPEQIKQAFAGLDPKAHYQSTAGAVLPPEAEEQKIRIAQASQNGGSSDIKEYEYAKQQGFNGTFEQWIQRKRQGAGEYGLNPIWGVDAKGEPVMLQAGKSGDAIQARLPAGVRLSKDPVKLDLGTHYGIMDPITRQMVATIPKDLKGAEQQKALGKVAGETEAALPAAESNAEIAVKQLEEIKNHPGRKNATGMFLGKVPPLPGTKEYDFVNRLDQAKSGAFLTAIGDLRGTGAITEIEGQTARKAKERMDRATTEAEFNAALADYETVIKKGVENMRKKAGQGGAPAKVRTFNPATGELE